MRKAIFSDLRELRGGCPIYSSNNRFLSSDDRTGGSAIQFYRTTFESDSRAIEFYALKSRSRREWLQIPNARYKLSISTENRPPGNDCNIRTQVH
jgi:hypothetical protein